MNGHRLQSWRGLVNAFDELFFSPRDTRACAVVRIGLASCVIIYLLVVGGSLELWFGEEGVLPFAASRAVIDSDTLPLFKWIPPTPGALWLCYGLFFAHAVLLLLGLWPRLQALGLLFWLQAFQVRNMVIVDGGDIVFRSFAFYLMFMPSADAFSVPAWWARRRGKPLSHVRPAWGLVLLRFQMGLIYLSSAWEKLNGNDWLDGTALYYVSRLDDNFSHGPLINLLVGSLLICKLMSWGTLVLEGGLPIFLWFTETRRFAVVAGVIFHLMLERTLDLFLFGWIMIVGLLAFLEADDFAFFARLWRRVRQRLGRPAQAASPARPA